MKRWLTIVFSLVMIFVLTACGDQPVDVGSMEQTDDNAEQKPQTASDDAQLDNGSVDADTDHGEISDENGGISIVYMTTDISPEGLMAVYEALCLSPV